jgi:hypothetical protein
MAVSNVQGLTGYIQVMKKIDSIYGKRLESLKKVLLVTAREMLRDFRNKQYSASQINSPKRNKPNEDTDRNDALAYAAAHQGSTLNPTRGKSWFNRSFRAARGVFPYVNADNEEIAIGMLHTMNYGAYLEYAYNRKFAVIEPLVRAYTPKVIQDIKKIFAGDGAP